MDSVTLITGAANGIGLATLEMMRAQGWKVAGVDRDHAALEAARARFADDPGILLIEQDLSDHAALPVMFARVLDAFGRVDALINSAALLGGTLDILELEIAEWDRIYALNVKTPFILMKLFVGHAIARTGGGWIVNVTSASAFRALHSKPAYGSSKAALGGLTRILSAQLGVHGINVNAVAPGITNTPGAGKNRNVSVEDMQAKVSGGPQENFFHRLTEAEDVAATITFLCSPASRQITGQTIHVSGGAITP